MIELSTYSLELLRNDKELNLYRGSNKYDDSQILVLSPGAEYPAPETLKRLEHERRRIDDDQFGSPQSITNSISASRSLRAIRRFRCRVRLRNRPQRRRHDKSL